MLQRISRDELDGLAKVAGFSLEEAETEDYLELTEYVLSIIDGLESRLPAPTKSIRALRDPGRRPAPGEDPYNAVVRWCRIKADDKGILSGKRIALKDSVAVAGVPMTCGSRILAEYVPDQDSIVTERILEAGGEIAAITNMDDLAFSGGGDSSCYGPTLCPFDPTRTSGGSSGGSAASLWYEGIDAAVGSDQGGSIRVPSAWCGVVGLKPTHTLVPYTGMAGIDQTFDHAGPMGRTVQDVAMLLQAIAGKHDSDPRQRDVRVQDYAGAVAAAPDGLEGVRLGLVAEGFGSDVGADDSVGDAVRAAAGRMSDLGAVIHERSLPEHVQAGDIAFVGFVEGMTSLIAGGGNGFHWAGRYSPDLAVALQTGLSARGDELPPQVKTALLTGTHLQRHYRGSLYAKAQNLRPWLRAAYDRALAEVDVLLLPTTPGLPHKVDPTLPIPEHVKRGWAVLANTYPMDFTGHPAITIPAAESSGLPVGVMLVGRRFEDARLLSIARTYEKTFGWLPDAGLVR